MEELVALEPGRTDFRVDYAISHWNIYLVCPKEQEYQWLTKAKAILEPLVQKGITHGQLQQLWEMVNKELAKDEKQTPSIQTRRISQKKAHLSGVCNADYTGNVCCFN
jgi:hypothetical protein